MVHNALHLDAKTLAWTLVGGLVGFALWELYSGWLNVFIFGFAFGPLPLIKGLTGITSDNIAFALHAVTGIVVYPLGYTLVLRPLLPGPWPLAALVLGVATWFLALGILAPLTGAPFMLGWGDVTWGSLIGHVLMGLGVGAVATGASRFVAARSAAT